MGFETLADPAMREVGASLHRNAQPAIRGLLPKDAPIVSADTHWEIIDDIFYENFPAHLKEKAPRVWMDDYVHIGYRGEIEAFPFGDRVTQAIVKNVTPGAWDAKVRLDHMDTEGIDKEVVFPQSLLAFIRYPDFEIQENMYRVYNDYIADRAKQTPGRFIPVGVFRNWWDPARADASMQQIVDLGMKVFMIPTSPGKSVDGRKISYADPIMDRFWTVVEEAGIPVTFHVGENIDVEHRGGIGTTVLTTGTGFVHVLGQLIFGGVFDRHPNLKVVFSEGGLAWVPPTLQDAEMIFDTYGNGDLLDPIEERPSVYWHRNCYATFQNDLLGLEQLDRIGADRVMWASDYPHSEGTFGFTWNSIESVVKATSADKALKILGGTATELYGL